MIKKPNSTTAKLLSFLQKNSGAKLSRKDLLKMEAPVSRATRHQKGKRPRPTAGRESVQDLSAVLADLELLRLITSTGNKVIPRDPFVITGRASLSPQGLVFVAPFDADPAARDIFVAPPDARDTLPGDEVLVRLTDRTRDRFEGTIIRVIKRARTLYRMQILDTKVRGGILGILLDVPARIPTCLDASRIPGELVRKIKADTVVIVSLSGASVKLMGVYFKEAEFKRFEDDTDLDTDFARILLKYNMDPVYPSGIPLPPANLSVSPSTVHDWKDRKDLRDLLTFTIDGADSKDFDDAISLLPGKNKNTARLFVHIADVSHYVGLNSPLDKEAKARATSVYLVNRVVPMLPPILSENLCSLVALVDRLAFTAEMEINLKNGEIKSYSFYKSIIHVDRRFTYDIAEQSLNDTPHSDVLRAHTETLQEMWRLASFLRERRIKEGRIDINMKEPAITIHPNTGDISIHYKDRLKSSMLIEEFMLSANQAAAHLMKKKKANTLYRVHDPMDEAKMENLNNFFALYNIPFELKDTRATSIQKSFNAIARHPDSVRVGNIYQMVLLRSFMQAVYRGQPSGHWGLAFTDYCHFTSPIRRYPDLVVHRVLAAITSKQKQPYREEEIEALGRHTSDMERKAFEAERDMQKLKVIRYIESSDQKRYRGVITGFRSDRVFLELEDLPVEGVVTLNHLTDGAELILPDRFSAFIKKLSRPAFLGEEWELELENIQVEEMKLYFKPVWKNIKKAF